MSVESSAHSGSGTSTRRVLLIVAIALVLGAGAFGYYQFTKTPASILVNGKAVANVESRSIAKHVLAEARELGSGGAPAGAVRFADRVTIRRASGMAELSDLPEAVRALEKAASVEGELFAISVDGRPIVALRSKADADRTLELVKSHYEQNLKHLTGKSSLKGNVFVEKRFISTGKFYKNPEDACRVLTNISVPPKMHTVERGDRVVHLARQYNISINELKALNPGINIDQLTEGDQLLIERAKLPVTVICRSAVTKTVSITAPPEVGRYGSARTGKRVVNMLVTYENGQPVSEEVVSQITTWDRPKYSYSESGSHSYSRRSHRRYRR